MGFSKRQGVLLAVRIAVLIISTQTVSWLFSVGSDVIFFVSNENSFSLPRETDAQSKGS
jgi:hypothetical protein